ncbi:hypothetical protein B484DRAFT_314974, partial [Ochromonadaceae sp. CCMP2298]
VVGAPPEAVWLQDGVVSGLMKQLYIPDGSSEEVKRVLRDILKARGERKKYDENGGQKRKGKKSLILDCTPQASVVYAALGSGLSNTQTAILLKEWRASQAPPLHPVSWSCVEGFVLRSNVINRSRRVTKKSGKEDL